MQKAEPRWRSGRRFWILSTRMLEQAETRDWQSLEALMSARDRLLKLYFADGAAPGRVEMLKEQIAVIQANDRLIVELTQKNRELLAEELIKLQRARQQILQYQKRLAVMRLRLRPGPPLTRFCG
jgi:hypothetical protein